jgi:outer membrane autotransporter protein
MVGWRHAVGDLTPLSSFTIQGNGFTVSGVPIAEDAFVTEAGVDVLLSDAVILGVSYAGQIASDAQEHGAKATATVNF